MIGLGKTDAPAFECGAIHRWGVKDGRSKKLADGVTGWASPERPTRVKVEGRGDRLSVQIDDHDAVQVRDADGYMGGQLGLVTQPGGSVAVRALAVRPVGPPKPAADLTDGFTPLATPDRLDGWEVEGEDRSWEMVGTALCGRQEKQSFNTKGHLLSAAAYSDLVLRFDFLVKPGATALVSLRAQKGETAAFMLNGVKTLLPAHPWLRLLSGTDDSRPRPGSLEQWFASRAIQPPVRGQAVLSLLTADVWHSAEIRVEGTAIAVVLDGKPIDYPRAKIDPKLNDPNYQAGQERKSGRIGFCPFAGEVQFRDIRVKEL